MLSGLFIISRMMQIERDTVIFEAAIKQNRERYFF